NAINSLDLNLSVQQNIPQASLSRTLFHTLNSNKLKENVCALLNSSNIRIQVIEDNILKQ
ncbi:24225_t:CDS:1, partial [Racocetra persica]